MLRRPAGRLGGQRDYEVERIEPGIGDRLGLIVAENHAGLAQYRADKRVEAAPIDAGGIDPHFSARIMPRIAAAMESVPEFILQTNRTD
ncbi:MAG: hypothetical protein R3C42_00615 [Parvularculaceae bacterium]